MAAQSGSMLQPISLSANANTTMIKQLLEHLQQELSNESLTSTGFSEQLDTYFEYLYELDAQEASLSKLSALQIRELLKQSFACRQLVSNKLHGWAETDEQFNADLLSNVYDINRALRYLEDYVLELAMSRQQMETEYVCLQGEEPYFMVAQGEAFQGPNDLRSGDVILSRGSAFTSAAIARIGVNDTQFSHLSLVYANPAEGGKLYTIEAHIEIGSVVEPIEKHLQQDNSRSVVYRFEDEDMAHRAAEYMFHKVKKHSDSGKNIDYNFSMQYEDTRTLFCSQVIYDGFSQASEQRVIVPRFKTQFNKGLIHFLNRMGIPATPENIDNMKTFSPGDIEFDPRFRLIAEWKDPLHLQDTRIKDAVLTKMFSWMDQEQYHIHPPFSVQLKSHLTWFFRRVPFIKKILVKKVPLNMSTGQLKVFLTLDKIGAVLQQKIHDVQAKQQQVLSLKEIFELLDAFRDEDLVSDQRFFHQWFHRREA